MPQPGLPLTPASSTDLIAKEYVKQVVEYGFSLGPPAIQSGASSASSNTSVKSDSSYRPTSPTSSRKRPRQEDYLEAQQEPIMTDYSTLPPPPTRSRRIIQMKPDDKNKARQTATEKADKKKATNSRTNSATTAAVKKTARKTAHSIIERRRRSKMNEEFETLKSMIPACTGQPMHKLAILQAGIDYMRYLEQCVADLQGTNRETQPPISIPQSQAPTPRQQSAELLDSEDDEERDGEGEGEEDTNIGDHILKSEEVDVPGSRISPPGYNSSMASPAILPQPPQSYQYATSTQSSTVPSPSFGPRNDSWSSMDRSRIPYSLSANHSPAILPQRAHDATEEASAALLMLNHDRRYSRSERPTGLSVQDLLSH